MLKKLLRCAPGQLLGASGLASLLLRMARLCKSSVWTGTEADWHCTHTMLHTPALLPESMTCAQPNAY